jgi:hypothetical protein
LNGRDVSEDVCEEVEGRKFADAVVGPDPVVVDDQDETAVAAVVLCPSSSPQILEYR